VNRYSLLAYMTGITWAAMNMPTVFVFIICAAYLACTVVYEAVTA